MSQQKKTTTRRKASTGTTTRRKNAAQRNREKEVAKREYEIKQDIKIVLIIAVSIFLFICNFEGACGAVGNVIAKGLFCIFGTLSYVAPLFIAAIFLMIQANPNNRIARLKISAFCSLFFLLQIALDLFAGISKTADVLNIKEFAIYYSDKNIGGGIIPSVISYSLIHSIGKIGGIVLIAALIIVAVIVITERRLIKGVKDTTLAISKKNKEERSLRLEYEENRAREIDEKREARKLEQERRREEKELRQLEQQKNKEALKQQKEDREILEKKVVKNNNITTDTMLSTPAVTIPTTHINDVHEIVLNNFDPSNLYEGESTQEEIIIIEEDEVEEQSDVFSNQSVNTIFEDTSSENHKNIVEPLKRDVIKQDAVKPVATVKPTEVNVIASPNPNTGYVFPPHSLLTGSNGKTTGDSAGQIRATAQKLQETLAIFGVEATVSDISQGPTVTRFELQPKLGTKVSRIKNLADDIKLNLAAADIRIEAPIPGKAAIGIEVPNKEPVPVIFKDMIESDEFTKNDSPLAFAVGKDISGKTIIYDIDKFPHVLIAGATGAGKSVCINTLIMSLIFRAHPDDVKFIMIDPKVVELSVYNGIPHLLFPVVTDMKKAAATLNYAVNEMMDRYKKFADKGARDIIGYNKIVEKEPDSEIYKKMPYIVIIVDEFADLILSSRSDVEDAICRLAALARACGIHLILATQRPSADVITGLIKANMPSRIAFSVASQVESRIILDIGGAEELLGKGDMLFYPKGLKKPVRLQGGFVSDSDVYAVVDFLRKQNGAQYDTKAAEEIEKLTVSGSASNSGSAMDGDSGNDDMFVEAGRFIIETQKASIGMLQRKFKMGFNRAARVMDQLAEANVVGPDEGTKPRVILMSMSDFESYIESNGL